MLATCKGTPCCLLCSPALSREQRWWFSYQLTCLCTGHTPWMKSSQTKQGLFFLSSCLYQMSFWRKVGLLAWVSVREEIRFRETEILRIVYRWWSRQLTRNSVFIVVFHCLTKRQRADKLNWCFYFSKHTNFILDLVYMNPHDVFCGSIYTFYVAQPKWCIFWKAACVLCPYLIFYIGYMDYNKSLLYSFSHWRLVMDNCSTGGMFFCYENLVLIPTALYIMLETIFISRCYRPVTRCI